jgi:hypothetical protein
MEIIIKVENDDELKRAEKFAHLVGARVVRKKTLAERQVAVKKLIEFTQQHGIKTNGEPIQMPSREERNAR